MGIFFFFLTDMNGYCCVGLPLYMAIFSRLGMVNWSIIMASVFFFFFISYELDLKF